MRKRTRSREFALQLLYQIDMSGAKLEEACQDFWTDRSEMQLTPEERAQVDEDKNDAEVREYADTLVRGVMGKLAEIDKLIERFAENWVIQRMAFVDRNILRLATFELRYADAIPVKVAINEAVELAKRYGEPDSSKFVNGILDKIAKDIPAKP